MGQGRTSQRCCGVCGKRSRPAARFCTACGSALEAPEERNLREAQSAARRQNVYRADGAIDCEVLAAWRRVLHLCIAQKEGGVAAAFPSEGYSWDKGFEASSASSIFGPVPQPPVHATAMRGSAASLIDVERRSTASGVRARGAIYAVAGIVRYLDAQAHGMGGKSPADAFARVGLNTREIFEVSDARLRLDQATVSSATAQLLDELSREQCLVAADQIEASQLSAEEFESDRWISEAFALHLKARRSAEDARPPLLERADAYIEQAHKKVIRQYYAMLAKAEAQQLFGRGGAISIRSGLSEAIGVLCKAQLREVSPTVAEVALHGMGSGSREIAREVSSLIDDLASASYSAVPAANQFADQG